MTPCIEHKQKGGKQGYGYTRRSENGRTYMIGLHRLAYCEAHGLHHSDIKGKVVMHKCDNPRCINPDHLQLGTPKENSEDMMRKGRHHKGETTPWAKLNARQVADIRRLYARGGISQRKLGEMYGVTQTNIGFIVRGETHQGG